MEIIENQFGFWEKIPVSQKYSITSKKLDLWRGRNGELEIWVDSDRKFYEVKLLNWEGNKRIEIFSKKFEDYKTAKQFALDWTKVHRKEKSIL